MGRDERGQTTPMIVGFFFILAILTAVVVDASAAYLQRQSLATLADGAALTGADGGLGGLTPYDSLGEIDATVDCASAQAAVATYMRDVRAHQRYAGLSYRVACTETTVTVRVAASLDLPLSVPGAADSARVGAASSAKSQLSQAGAP